jgi:hypothetical protein
MAYTAASDYNIDYADASPVPRLTKDSESNFSFNPPINLDAKLHAVTMAANTT